MVPWVEVGANKLPGWGTGISTRGGGAGSSRGSSAWTAAAKARARTAKDRMSKLRKRLRRHQNHAILPILTCVSVERKRILRQRDYLDPGHGDGQFIARADISLQAGGGGNAMQL